MSVKTIALLSLIVLTSTNLLADSSEIQNSRFHRIQKRSCNFRGEECTKDIECCTASCMCRGSDPCYCGKRPRPKIAKFESGSLTCTGK
uniref:U5-Hypotoxin-Hsp1a_1 n=1 Tax=Hypochilus sp. SGP-2016 TaxID=1905178 RepID=A0A482Z8T0_9ARAC